LDGSESEEYWRQRSEQLQHALTSRVAIEQAKGVLSERLGVSTDGAFQILRYAARSAQVKLHALAVTVMDSEETPPEIVRAVARHQELLAQVPRPQRIRQTEGFFRAVNQEIAAASVDASTEFVCECGNPVCTARIAVGARELHALHAEPDLFVVIDGHQIPDVETVVNQLDGYLIVRKDKS
jgi:hypothetical protein